MSSQSSFPVSCAVAGALTLGLSSAVAQVTTGPVVFNEVLASNDASFSPDGGLSSPDAIELRNLSDDPVDLSGFGLSDDPAELDKWTVPGGTILAAGEFLVILANGQDRGLETNFRLSARGESLVLSTPSGTIVQQLDFPRQRTDFSYGRMDDGSYAFNPNVTIGLVNDDSSALNSLLRRPQTDEESGLYDVDSLVVSLVAEPGVTIRFTSDGSTPTETSAVYSGPFTFTETTVLKSIAIDDTTGVVSDIASRSFIFTDVQHDLPVLIITPDEFEDISSIDQQNAYGSRNFAGRIRIDFLETDGSLPVSQYAEFTPSGLTSQTRPPFNGKIEARARFGRSLLEHAFFPEKDETEFERILVRNASQDFSQARLRDGIVSRMLSEGDIVDVEHEGHRPAVVYLNGDYVGHMNIREDDDREFVRQYFDLPSPVIQGTSSLGRLGSMYRRFADRVTNRNAPDAIQRLNELVDVDEAMIDLAIRSSLQAFEETSFWSSASDPSARERTSLHDYDFCFGFAFPGQDPGVWDEVDWERSGFSMAGENTRFGHDGIQSCAAFLMHLGYPERINPIIEATAAEIRSEIPRTAEAFLERRNPAFAGSRPERNLVVESLAEWEGIIDELQDYTDQRLTGALDALAATYSFGIVEIDIQTSDRSMGEVMVHGYRVLPDREEGRYLADIPLRMQAVAKPGFTFAGWEGDVPVSEVNSPNLEVSLNGRAEVIATFVQSPLTLAISEIHYNPAGTSEDDEFLEFVNYGAAPIDVSGVNFRSGLTFTFPANTTLAAGERVVIRPTDYTGSLDNDGETLTLSDASDVILSSVTFNDAAPWPNAADGGGFSLVRIDPSDLATGSVASAWRLSSQLGGNAGTSDSLPLVGTSVEDISDYAFGTAPSGLLPSANGDGTFDLSFQRVINADAVEFRLTSTSDLVSPWVPVLGAPFLSESLPENGLEIITIESLPVTESARFYRVEARPR